MYERGRDQIINLSQEARVTYEVFIYPIWYYDIILDS